MIININFNTKMIVNTVTKDNFKIPSGHELISLDVEALYMNMPVMEAIELAAKMYLRVMIHLL